MHFHSADVYERAGNFGAETQRNAFLGLEMVDGRLAEQHEGGQALLRS